MRGERSRRGGSSTTRSGHTAAWDTKPRKSLLLLRPQASTPLSERQGTQTPSLAPRAPPSRLKPEREQLKVVVFLRERKQGAGQVLLRLVSSLIVPKPPPITLKNEAGRCAHRNSPISQNIVIAGLTPLG